MSGALSPSQFEELRWAAGVEPRTCPPSPQIRRQLRARGLTYNFGGVTPLGRAAALLDGHVLNQHHQELVVALADGTVRGGNKWHLNGEFSRAPAAALKRLEEIGVARGRLHGGTLLYDATSLGHRVAVILRQQPLPPPCGP